MKDCIKYIRLAKEAVKKEEVTTNAILPRDYGHDGTDNFNGHFKKLSEEDAKMVETQLLLSKIEGNLGVYCCNKNCPSKTIGRVPKPMDPLMDLEPRPMLSLTDGKNSYFTCKWCLTKMCRVCRDNGKPIAWHINETCEEFHNVKTLTAHADTLLINAYSKRCPKCNSNGTHFHGHHCHHISPRNSGANKLGGCSRCHHHYCYACAEYTINGNQIIKGPPARTEIKIHNYCSKEPRHELYCFRDNIENNIDKSNGWPIDRRCGCAICPYCKPGKSCGGCGGSCVVCKGIVPPGAPVGELKVLVDKAREREKNRINNNDGGETKNTATSLFQYPYANELLQLKGMGFINDEEIIRKLLVRSCGNITEVVSHLCNM